MRQKAPSVARLLFEVQARHSVEKASPLESFLARTRLLLDQAQTDRTRRSKSGLLTCGGMVLVSMTANLNDSTTLRMPKICR
jgi:hypothetical protein